MKKSNLFCRLSVGFHPLLLLLPWSMPPVSLFSTTVPPRYILSRYPVPDILFSRYPTTDDRYFVFKISHTNNCNINNIKISHARYFIKISHTRYIFSSKYPTPDILSSRYPTPDICFDHIVSYPAFSWYPDIGSLGCRYISGSRKFVADIYPPPESLLKQPTGPEIQSQIFWKLK